MVTITIEWVDGKIEDAEIPEGLIGYVLPGIYRHKNVWRVYCIGEDGIPFPTYREWREKYGGIITPDVDNIEKRRHAIDIDRFAKEIDQIGKIH